MDSVLLAGPVPSPGPGKPLDCMNSPDYASRVRAFFTFGLDLGDYESVTAESIARLQELRANGGLLTVYGSGLAEESGFAPAARSIADDAKEAVARGGKEVWSQTFLTTRAPWRTPTPNTFDSGVEEIRPGASLKNNGDALEEWVFDTARGHLTPDGVVVLTLSFRHDTRITVEDLISTLRSLRSLARKMFDLHAIELVRDGSPVRRVLEREGFKVGVRPISEKVRSHRTIFVQQLACSNGKACDAHRVRDSLAVAGIMNLAEWYPEYHEEYRGRIAQKEFGYKSTELYLTDHDATLAIQSGFWKDGDPLRNYMSNVLQAIEYHVGLQALLRGQLQYARTLYSLTARRDLSNDTAVDGVRRSRAILSGAYESLNYSVLVLHGFTRRLLNLLDQECEIIAILEDVERRVANVSDAVTLQASVDLQKFGNGIDSRVLAVTKVAAWVGALALVVSLISLAVTLSANSAPPPAVAATPAAAVPAQDSSGPPR